METDIAELKTQFIAAGRTLGLLFVEVDAPHVISDIEMANPTMGDRELAATARTLIEQRRLRVDLLDIGQMTGEPAWEILLDLFIASVEGRSISVSSACLASGAPITTGIRYIARMVGAGLLFRDGRSADGRVVPLRLTNETMDRMRDYLRRIAVAR